MITTKLNSNSFKPLNILFFGSDLFSIHSLKSLLTLKGLSNPITNEKYINSLHLVTKPAKWCGRDKSILRETDISRYIRLKNIALNTIECDSKEDLLELTKSGNIFTTSNINLIVAVSYGELLPSELINKSEFGGLNVHPSLLPRYKGSSPIQYALLNKDFTTGVTVQDLHPTKFDCGNIIKQTSEINIKKLLENEKNPFQDLKEYCQDINKIPINTLKLTNQLGIIGGNLLHDLIKSGIFLPSQRRQVIESSFQSTFAPRIKPEMRKIKWETDCADSILIKRNTLGPMYCLMNAATSTKKRQLLSEICQKRVILHEFWVENSSTCLSLPTSPGQYIYDDETQKIYVRCGKSVDQHMLVVNKIQLQNFAIESSAEFIKQLPKRCGKQFAEARHFL